MDVYADNAGLDRLREKRENCNLARAKEKPDPLFSALGIESIVMLLARATWFAT